jgi:hypothetical protein
MLLTLAASAVFIISASGHVCSRKCCRTCDRVAEQIALLCSFALLGIAVRAVLTKVAALRACSAGNADVLKAGCTLVGWKVRLNN